MMKNGHKLQALMYDQLMQHSFEDNAEISQLTEVLKIC